MGQMKDTGQNIYTIFRTRNKEPWFKQKSQDSSFTETILRTGKKESWFK